MTYNFNLSYSAYSVFKRSPLEFYFLYIQKAPKSNILQTDYGRAGTVVHKALEKYIKKQDEGLFEYYWTKKGGDNFKGFQGRALSKELYKKMFETGVAYLKSVEYKIQPEIRIDFDFHGISVKGFIDMKSEDGLIIEDWKTDSKNNYKKHLDQRLFYSWMLWKTKSIIPRCNWIYLRDNKIHSDKFTEAEMIAFDKEIQDFLKFIKENQHNINKFEGGAWKHPFNQHTQLCADEIERRQAGKNICITMNINGHYVFLEGDIPWKLENGLDFATKFNLPDKHFMQQAVKKKARGFIDISDVGTIHLYNKRFRCFPIGLIDKITNICKEFGEYYGNKVKIILKDSRDKKVMERKINMPDKLITDKVLRDYQKEAVDIFMEKKAGVIAIATGGGKTFVASEIIRRCQGKTLWIIDRKELLLQTKKVLEELLGVEIGIIASGEMILKDITIATIQSLNSKTTELREYMYNVNCVVVDEFHKSAAETYQKIFMKLPNSKYRLGLTATPQRDDGKSPILFSILDEIIYKVTSQDLIKMGFLVQPTIEFYDLKGLDLFKMPYAEDYEKNIVKNKTRNMKILEICVNNFKKKILILTKSVTHGTELKKCINGAEHIHGSLGKNTRDRIMNDFRYGLCKILIMTLSIGSEGLDIPDLDIIINAAANKGDVKSIQVLGRVLRTFTDKSEALYIDFVDVGYHTRKHSEARMKAFKAQGYPINTK